MACVVAKAVGLEVLQWGLVAVPVFVTGHQLTSSGNSSLSANQGSPSIGKLSLVAYWMILLGSFLLVTLAVHIPVKIFLFKQRQSTTNATLEWRPSILLYNLLSALPCYVMILIGIQAPLSNVNAKLYEDAIYVTTPTILLCLIATEWVAKWKEDEFSSDMAEAMLNDFHTAYDIMELISLGLDDDIASKTWPIFAIFALSLLAMFKYVPRSPKYKNDGEEFPSGNSRAQKWLLTNIFVQDLPFFTLRLTLICLYGLKAGELLYPAKSAAGLVFRSLQLYLMKTENRKVSPSSQTGTASEEHDLEEKDETVDVEDIPTETLED
ncbi:uncharacterized protein [Branchiostoma lanceolatum]|uniref:uncharacterized protein n=1 Tax=Branchiostoma lanceolatum TaxID=7740 RepID=UPI00345253B5